MAPEVHVVVFWGTDIVHVARVVRGQRFLLSDVPGALQVPWTLDETAEPGAARRRGARARVRGSSEALVDFTCRAPTLCPIGSRPKSLAPDAHEMLTLGPLRVRVSVGTADPSVRHWKRVVWDRPLVVCALLSLILSLTLLTLSAASIPELAPDRDLKPPAPWLAESALIRVSGLAEPETEQPAPDVSLWPATRLNRIDGHARCGDEFAMGTPSPPRDARYAVSGPKDNPDPHLARLAGPERPAIREHVALPPLKHAVRELDEHKDPKAPTVSWGRDSSLGVDERSARAAIWGAELEDAEGHDMDGQLSLDGGKVKHIQVPALRAATRTQARVVHTKLRVSGHVSGEHISRAMLGRLAAFRRCYLDDASSSAGARGYIELAFTTRIDGSFAPRVRGSEAVRSAVASCLERAAADVEVPGASGNASFVYPLELIPSASAEAR